MSNSTPKNRKLTTEEFIERATKKHNGKYSYEKSVYISAKTKIIVTCPDHGDFKTESSSHMLKTGCPECAGIKRLTTDKFIQRSIAIHGDRYDYSRAEYIKNSEKVEIICKKHGSFYQTPANHMLGNNCPYCANKNVTLKNFIEKAKEVHGDRYDYSLVEYNGNASKVKIICKKHGVFEQRASNHLYWNGCKGCRLDQKKSYGFSQEEIIKQFKDAHGDLYDYSLVEYTGIDNPVKIICKSHGEFNQTPYHHKKNSAGCPICTKVTPYSRTKYVNACKSKGGKSSIYIIKMKLENEVFYKVGITNNTIEQRFQSNPYQIELLRLIGGDAGFIYDLEKSIHRLLSEYHYKPKIKFGGHALECFSEIPKSIIDMLDKINGSKQLQLIA